MPSGVVKKWVEDKGFGFLLPDNGGHDVFVHRSALNGFANLSPGDRVMYDAKDDGKSRGKLKASNVVLTLDGHELERSDDSFEGLPPSVWPPSPVSTTNCTQGVEFFLQVAGKGVAALPLIQPFIIESSLGCPFLVLSQQQLVATIRAPSRTEFRSLLGLANAYIVGCETSRSTFIVNLEGEMLGHGGELTTAVLQLTYSVEGRELTSNPIPTGMPMVLGLLIDMRSEVCITFLRHIMESRQITKLLWDAERVLQSLMYQEQPRVVHMMPVAVVDAKMAFSDLALDSMPTHACTKLLTRQPRRDPADVEVFEANNERVVALPLSDLGAAHTVDEVHRIEAILCSQAPSTGSYVHAKRLTDCMLNDLSCDPQGLKTLGQRMGRFEASSGVRRTATAVAIWRHILSLRSHDLGAAHRIVEDIGREVALELLRSRVKVPEDLSFSVAAPVLQAEPPDTCDLWQ